jgi:two-component system response regulator GlrR
VIDRPHFDVPRNESVPTAGLFPEQGRLKRMSRNRPPSIGDLRAETELKSTSIRKIPITVGLVYRKGSRTFADSLQSILGSAPGFTCLCLELQERLASSRMPVAGDQVDVLLVNVGDLSECELKECLAWLRNGFAKRPVLVALQEKCGIDPYATLEAGASDFLLLPVQRFELVARIVRQAGFARARADEPNQRLKEQFGLKHIIGESRAFMEKVICLPRFARSEATVLVLGESGTGKEVFARAIHYLSSRAGYPFIPVNCGALPEGLVESEIFGHKRGAFTGAASDQRGLIQEAEGGTLFLDEIDSLTRPGQVKLLRFLQDGEYRPVGGSQQVAFANVRVIAASNTDLAQMVRDSRFREDLFYRLNVLKLNLPALREREGDIQLLAEDFLKRQMTASSEQARTITLAALHRLLSYSWPGNVRELHNVLMRATLLSDGHSIEASDLDLGDEVQIDDGDQSFRAAKSRVIQRFEREFLMLLLRAHGGNITRAANAARKNRRAFWELLRKHGLLAR